VNRIGRRTIICMLAIVAFAIVIIAGSQVTAGDVQQYTKARSPSTITRFARAQASQSKGRRSKTEQIPSGARRFCDRSRMPLFIGRAAMFDDVQGSIEALGDI
jgi:hypothetical protein